MITFEELKLLYPRGNRTLLHLLADPGILEAAGLETNIQLAHFLSQFGYETSGFRHLVERIDLSRAENSYGRHTRVGRILGNTQPGDGAKFIGRGLCMLTGRWNYRTFSEYVMTDLVSQPDMLEFPSYAVDVGIAFWNRRGLTALSKDDNVELITRRINGGTNGLKDRGLEFKRILTYLNSRTSSNK